MDKIAELLTRGVENIIPSREQLKKLLLSGKKLNIYLGIDPTSTKIHLGHAVPLRKIQAFAELGHHVTFLIGDFTALVGDTSDKESERPSLSSDQIHQNFQTYKKQAEKFVDFGKVKVKFNSEWLSKLKFADLIKLCQHYSAGDFVGRELIKKRLAESKHVGLHELLYPVMQGFDSYQLDTDIQVGGTDQTFNMQAGRILQKNLRNKESFVLANGFLTGTDGRKMSKTWNNGIWIEDLPNDVYGKIMSLKDDLIGEYFLLATNLPMEKVKEAEKRLANGENPINLKKELASEIVKELYNEKEAQKAKEYFERTIQNKETPEDMLIFHPSANVLSSLATVVEAGFAASNSQGKILIKQGGFYFNNERVNDPSAKLNLKNGDIIRKGTDEYRKVVIK